MESEKNIEFRHDASARLVGGDAIDTQAPLILLSEPGSSSCTLKFSALTYLPLCFFPETEVLLLDLLAIHMVRNTNGSTIINYHPQPEDCTTSANDLYTRAIFIGERVYWQGIFRDSTDPTSVLLAIFWHAFYAWDEPLQSLYTHLCWLVSSESGTLCGRWVAHILRWLGTASYQYE